jgi:hypothetical protein
MAAKGTNRVRIAGIMFEGSSEIAPGASIFVGVNAMANAIKSESAATDLKNRVVC